MEQFADLHVHTNLSDGSDSVHEVLALAARNNVEFLSVTDYNTVAAYTEDTFREADRLGVKLIPGVELDVIHEGKQYHMLGFGVDVKDKGLLDVCAHNADMQEVYNLELLRRMELDSLGVAEADYNGYEIPGGRGGWRLLNYLMDIGLTGSLLEGLKYYGQYGFKTNTIKFISLKEAIETVRGAGGVPILAHPGEQIPYNQYGGDNAGFWSELEGILQAGIEGVECIHPLHGFGLQRELLALCQERGLYISGGTDYHGSFFSKQKQVIGGQFVSLDSVSKLINHIID